VNDPNNRGTCPANEEAPATNEGPGPENNDQHDSTTGLSGVQAVEAPPEPTNQERLKQAIAQTALDLMAPDILA